MKSLSRPILARCRGLLTFRAMFFNPRSGNMS
jgi:hypothetical protein